MLYSVKQRNASYYQIRTRTASFHTSPAMLADEPLCHGEHPLRDVPFKVGGFLAVRVDAECLLDVPCEVLLLVLPRVEELGGRGSEGNHHHRFLPEEVGIGDSRVKVAFHQAAIRTVKLSVPASCTEHVGYYAVRPRLLNLMCNILNINIPSFYII